MRYTVGIKSNTWIAVSVPLGLFSTTTSISWQSIRQIAFQLNSFGPSDNSCVYLDGLQIKTDFTYYNNVNSVNEIVLPNIISYLNHNEVRYVYNGTAYIGLNNMMAFNGSDTDQELQSETLAQTIFSLCLAYNYTHYGFLLDRAKTYWNWLSCYQNSVGFIMLYYNNAAGTFPPLYVSGTSDGWFITAGSLLYNFYPDPTLRQSLDKCVNWWVSNMWNSTTKCFNLNYYLNTRVMIYASPSGWNPMKEGALTAGLGAYSTYVTQNTTVLALLNTVVNSALTRNPKGETITFGSNAYEDNFYQYWGLYFANQATTNSTFLTALLDSKDLLFTLNELSTNASMLYHFSLAMPTADTYGFDGWGWACSLPLWLEMYQASPDQHLLDLYGQAVWDLLPQILTPDYSITRFRGGSSDWNNVQYTPSNAFIYASIAMYYNIAYRPATPIIVSANNKILSLLPFTIDHLTFIINATTGQSSTTFLDTKNYGAPLSVINATYNYNDTTKLLTLTVLHLSASMEVSAYWQPLPSPTPTPTPTQTPLSTPLLTPNPTSVTSNTSISTLSPTVTPTPTNDPNSTQPGNSSNRSAVPKFPATIPLVPSLIFLVPIIIIITIMNGRLRKRRNAMKQESSSILMLFVDKEAL